MKFDWDRAEKERKKMSRAVKISRKKPKGFENISEIIQIRTPLAKDMFGLNFDGENLNRSCAILISRCSSLSFEEISALETPEFLKLQDVINELMEVRK